MKHIYSNAYEVLGFISFIGFISFVVMCLFLFIKYIWGLLNGFGSRSIEGFTWSKDLIGRFNTYQDSVNINNNQFNLKIVQEQASPNEVEQLLKTGYWPWSEDIQNQYLEAVWQNPIIKFSPDHALDYAMKLYNETSAKRLMSWNVKEGEFLLYGGTNKNKNIIKCSDDTEPVMQKTTFNNNPWIGTKINIANENIPNEMPGFTFIKEPCNPCSVLNNVPDYRCPFKLNIKGDNETSDVWKNLWQL
jgi:hypothetical protein